MNESSAGSASSRMLSLDAYRGFVMLAMASGGLGVARVAQHFPDSDVWQVLDRHLVHVAWRGGSFWDLIQPSFMFIVGVAMPFSFATRRARGDGWWTLFGHALWRSIVLVLLGVFLASAGSPRTNFAFTNVLAQIGLGYMVVFLLLGRSPRTQFLAAIAILVADWLFFALYSPTDPINGLDAFLLPTSWHDLTSPGAHWNMHENAAAAFDHWFLNLFPQPTGKPFNVNPGGYATLNFVPSIATMLFGVLAGEFLRSPRTPRAKLQGLFIAGTLGLVIGTALDGSICPIVKRIWTPSWTIFSAGWTSMLLALFYGVIDVVGWRRWAFPLVVVGVNSIAMYLMAQLMKPFVSQSLKTHLGPRIFDVRIGNVDYNPIAQSVAVLLVFWLICLWMYRRRIFLKI
jgi:heparan-alpha-glucosaminide N-acetyltransferase